MKINHRKNHFPPFFWGEKSHENKKGFPGWDLEAGSPGTPNGVTRGGLGSGRSARMSFMGVAAGSMMTPPNGGNGFDLGF